MKKVSVLFLVLAMFFSGCGKKSPTTPEPPPTPAPTINSFTATPSIVAKGDSSMLEWSTTNATSCTIDNGIGGVSSTSLEFVYPEETTTYTLTATNETGSRTATCTVEVRGADLRIVGVIRKTLWGFFERPTFEGYVKNFGDNTAWNAAITIYCYSDVAQTTIIDTAWDYLADGNDIRPGEKVTFEAICWELDSHDEIKSFRVEIDWLEEEITTLSSLEIKRLNENKRRFRELEIKKARGTSLRK